MTGRELDWKLAALAGSTMAAQLSANAALLLARQSGALTAEAAESLIDEMTEKVSEMFPAGTSATAHAQAAAQRQLAALKALLLER